MAVRTIPGTGRGGRKKMRKAAEMRLLDEVPPHPDHFDEGRAGIWQETCRILISMSNLCESDLGIVETYCQALSDYREFTRILTDEGHFIINTNGNRVQHPANYLRKGAEQQINLAASALCLSPRGRFALKRDGGIGIDDEANEAVALKAVANF